MWLQLTNVVYVLVAIAMVVLILMQRGLSSRPTGPVALQSHDRWSFLPVGQEDGGAVVHLRRRAGPGDPPRFELCPRTCPR